jgi:hypothetical protein
MSTEAPKVYAWWTPGGWEQRPGPAEYAPVEAADTDIDEAMKAAGYHRLTKLGDAGNFETDYEVSVSVNAPDQHLFVEMWGIDCQLCEFFVAAEHRAPFILDALPWMLATSAGTEIVNNLRAIRKTLVAFVRHGEGEGTIDEYGERTADDRRHADVVRRARQRAEAAAAAKAATP